jgi:hypothetical protein
VFGAIGILLVPEYLQRADPGHLLPATMSMAAGCLLAVAAAASSRLVPAAAHSTAVLPAAVIGLLGLVATGIPVGTGSWAVLSDLGSGGRSFAVTNHGRWWDYATPGQAGDVRRLLACVDRVAPPGAALLVGTADLSQTPYIDNSFYFLLPQLGQKGHFYDFHPGIALRQGGQLAADVRRADVVITWRFAYHEPNLSRRHGSQEANQILSTQFRPVCREGPYTAFLRSAPRA